MQVSAMRRNVIIIPLILAALFFGIAPHHAAAQENTLNHTIQPGETLLEVELFYGLTPQELAVQNTVLAQNALLAVGTGDNLVVPIAVVQAQAPTTNKV